MTYAAEKHEPATMKKKADLMLKKGSISDKEHKKLHAKADVEIDKAKQFKTKPSVDALSAKGKVTDAASDKEVGKDTPGADDPSLKRRKPGKADVERGEPDDPDL
jgi:hypothetical protein